MAIAHAWDYLFVHREEILAAIQTHASLSACALGIAMVAGIPLGIWCSRRNIGSAVVSAFSAARVVPSLAVLTLMLPLLGLGFAPALVALILLAWPPILINTYVGYRDVDPAAKEAAFGMGMTARQVMSRVESPLAFPIVIAGVRTAAVEVIASATLATFIGGGGLGDLINNGLQLNDTAMLLTGSACVTLMALAVELVLNGVGRLVRTA
jgi:osmoprotectant transport system permease protein